MKWRDDGIAMNWFSRKVDNVTGKDRFSKHIVEEIGSELQFHGPFVGNQILTKYFTTADIHDYIKMKVRFFGFGVWDIEKFDYFGYASLLVNGEYVFWANTFNALKRCQSIENDDKWSDWLVYRQIDLPIDINFDSICYFDVNVLINNKETFNSFSMSLTANLDNGFDSNLDEINLFEDGCMINGDIMRTEDHMVSDNFRAFWGSQRCQLYLANDNDKTFVYLSDNEDECVYDKTLIAPYLVPDFEYSNVEPTDSDAVYAILEKLLLSLIELIYLILI